MSDPQFYLGRRYDQVRDEPFEQTLGYDPADLTTHAVVTGMTGSGKTGLCIALLLVEAGGRFLELPAFKLE